MVGILFLSIYLFAEQKFAWSFIFAFMAFCGIIFAVLLTQKNEIHQLIANATQEELEALAMPDKEDNDLDEEKEKGKHRIFWGNFDKNSNKVGIKMFFMPFRLLAYAFLVIGFFILLKQGSLDIVGFFSGLVVANVMIVSFYFLSLGIKEFQSRLKS